MKTNLYVGGLPYSIADAQLETIFSEHGTVASARVITERDSGRSKGFGFVEMSTSDEAQKAMDALNGTEVEGRTLTVNEARDRNDRPRDGGGGGRGNYGGSRW